MSYTYAVLELSPEAYAEIKLKLRQAGHGRAVQDGPGGEVVDMTGIAVRSSGDARLPQGSGFQKRLRESAALAAPGGLPIQERPYRPPSEIDVTAVEFRGDEPVLTRPRRDMGPIRPVPESEAVEGPPPPLPGASVRIAVRNDDGDVLALDRGDGEGFNLPGGPVADGESVRDAAIRILDEQAGLEAEDVTEIWSGTGDKWQSTTFFTVLADNGVEVQTEDGCRTEFVKVQELMCGAWGLAARDAFNAAGWMRRPRLSWQAVYEMSARALRNGSHRDDKGVEEVIDEITFLADVGKLWAVDALLEDVDVSRLHGDVADTLLAMLEPLKGLRHKPRIEREIERRLEDLDGLRTPIRFMGHDDVRAAARKIYRQRAAEFSKMLRDGTLAEKFGGRHRGGPPIRKDLPPEWERPPDDAG